MSIKGIWTIALFALLVAPTPCTASLAAKAIRMPVVRVRTQVVPLVESGAPAPAHQPYAGTVKTFPGTYQQPQAIVYDVDNGDFYLSDAGGIYQVTPTGYATKMSQMTGTLGLAYDSATKLVYIATYGGVSILAMDPNSGATTLLAGGTRGTNDGHGAAAQFQLPQGIAVDPSGSNLYVTDHDRVRTVTTSGDVTTLTAPGSLGSSNGSCAGIEDEGIAFDTYDGNLYVADSCTDTVRQVNIASQNVVSIAGQCVLSYYSQCQTLQNDGVGKHALFADPTGIVYNSADNRLYLTDQLNNQIRKVSAGGAVSTIAGSGHVENINGVGNLAGFTYPAALTIGPGSKLYIADEGNSIIRTMVTIGPSAPKPLHGIAFFEPPTLYAAPSGLAATADGSIWFGENGTNFIGRMFPNGKMMEYPIGGNGISASAMVADTVGDVWFVAGAYSTQYIGVINSSGSVILYSVPNSSGSINELTIGADGNVWFACSSGFIGNITSSGAITEYLSDFGEFITSGFKNDLWTSGGFIEEYSLQGAMLKKYVNPSLVPGWMTHGPGNHVWFSQPAAIGEVMGNVLLLYGLPSAPPGYSWNVRGLVEAPDTSMWFASSIGYLGRLTTTGKFTPIEVRTPRSQPESIIVAPNGTLWFTDPGAMKIGKWY